MIILRMIKIMIIIKYNNFVLEITIKKELKIIIKIIIMNIIIIIMMKINKITWTIKT